VQLNNVKTLFGVMTYQSPTLINGKHPVAKFSTGICLCQDNEHITQFNQLNAKLEQLIQTKYQNSTHQFVSCAKKNLKGEVHLRVKLPTKGGFPQFDLIVDGVKSSPTKPELDRKLYHGRKANVLLKLNPLWSSGNKYGISWRLVTIELIKNEFRTYDAAVQKK